MQQKVIFTICAKNYLAQAYALKESSLKHNPSVDFKIFLSDKSDSNLNNDIIEIGDEWIPDWRHMAIKYDVVEFSTSIKPFCIRKFFNEGYAKVMYIDPDIYFFDSVEYVWDHLDNYSVVLTPHRCYPIQGATNSIDEASVSNFGIYNLGFIGLKNDEVGNKIAEWWCEKLSSQCYNSKSEGLFVDQKWMDFIPAFYPSNVLITHHLGLNAAEWNLQERDFYFDGDKPMVRNKYNPEETFPLVFFHFSSYSPLTPSLIDKRGRTTTSEIPNITPLFEEYYECEMRNDYEKYSKFQYAFNTFENNQAITSLHRRLYRIYEKKYEMDKNPFSEKSLFYQDLAKQQLLVGVTKWSERVDDSSKNIYLARLNRIMLLIKKIVGIKNYMKIIKLCKYYQAEEKHGFLLN